jgi:hypothetical protein
LRRNVPRTVLSNLAGRHFVVVRLLPVPRTDLSNLFAVVVVIKLCPPVPRTSPHSFLTVDFIRRQVVVPLALWITL